MAEDQQRRELVEYLVSLGATSADLEAYRDELPALASVLSIRGGPGLTVAEVAERSGAAPWLGSPTPSSPRSS